MKKELSRRSGVRIAAELMKLLGGRLSAVMLLAVLNGSLGFLCAMGVPFFGAVGIAKALGESIPLSYGAIAALCVGCGVLRGDCGIWSSTATIISPSGCWRCFGTKSSPSSGPFALPSWKTGRRAASSP
ncbi:MAG: hypothetical protein ACLSHM_12820 [Vescimonas sp.]